MQIDCGNGVSRSSEGRGKAEIDATRSLQSVKGPMLKSHQHLLGILDPLQIVTNNLTKPTLPALRHTVDVIQVQPPPNESKSPLAVVFCELSFGLSLSR